MNRMDDMERGGGQLVPYRPAEEFDIRVAAIKVALPWVLMLVVLLAGVITHAAWGSSPALPWITAGLTLAVGVLAWLSWTVTTRSRLGPVGRAHIAGTVAAVGVWLLLATVLGPWTRGVLDAWGLAGATLAVSWNLRGVLHRPRRGEGEGEDGAMTPRKAGKALLASLGMRGDALVPEEVNPNRIAGRLELGSGNNTTEDVQKRAAQIATALSIPKSGVRITENKDNAAEPEFSFTLKDLLTNTIPWNGPSAVGGTAFDPIPMGLYETGKVMVKTIADKAGAKHEVQQGMSGAGKSSGAKVEVCELMTRREVNIIVIDTVKGLQTFGPAAEGLALFITETEKAQRLMKRLMHVVTGRASWLGARGLSEWQPGCGLTFLVVQIEEAGNLLAEIGDEELELLVKAARSAGVSIKVSLQRPSHDQISTTTRAQLGTVTCYGMANDDPVCMLPDAVIDAGADPRQWNDRQPGCNYVAGTGITVADAATPLRNFDISMQQMQAHAAHWGPRMDDMDPVTAKLLGDLWARRERPADMVRRMSAAALGGLPAVVDGEVVDRRVADEDDVQVETDNQDAEDPDMTTEDISPEDMGIVLDPDEEDDDTGMDDAIVPVDVEFTFGPATVEVSVEQARAAVAERLAHFQAEGDDVVRVPDFTDMVTSGMRSRSWFRKELLRLVAAGRLAETGEAGAFRIIGDADTDRGPDAGDAERSAA